MIKYPSIEQFKNVIKEVTNTTRYMGKDENGVNIYNNDMLPVLRFKGTTKIHGCVHKDTLVRLSNGSQEKICDIIPGTSILSYNETTGLTEFDVVTEVISQNLDKPWIKLEFDNGTHLKCTTDHPILTTEGWVIAENLTENHTLIEF